MENIKNLNTEVPMPEPAWVSGTGWGIKMPPTYTTDQMRTYGDAREAAGYARCLREMLDCRTCRNYVKPIDKL